MKLTYKAQVAGTESLGCLVLFLSEDRPKAPSKLDAPLRKAVDQAKALEDFSGKTEDSLLLLTGAKQIPRLLLIGLGKTEKLDAETLRRAAGKAAQRLVKLNLSRAGLWVPEGLSADLAAGAAGYLAEGSLLGAYTFKGYKEEKPEDKKRQKLAGIVLYDPEKLSDQAALEAGVSRGEAVCLARNLGNRPANAMTPTALAQEARNLAKRHELKVQVLERDKLEKLGMGLFLGVSQGSHQPPKLIVLEYRPRGAKGTLAFVGKGITFDSGGISLKSGQDMDEMKFDMCGAAAVLGAVEGIARMGLPVNVVGIVPACENLPGGSALKPGDILRSFSGKHVEVLNTDAEGRLILADALAYGIQTYKPDAVVDLATLTGACVVALGHYATGAVNNDGNLMDQVVQAGKRSGDIVWPLPNFPEYEEGLKAKYGDLQNIAGREGGAITAGLFLKNFVGEVPWVHLDIAGTAWGVKNIGYIPNEGATGVGVRLLVDLAAHWKGAH